MVSTLQLRLSIATRKRILVYFCVLIEIFTRKKKKEEGVTGLILSLDANLYVCKGEKARLGIIKKIVIMSSLSDSYTKNGKRGKKK